jgi:Glycosyl hydrolase family 26
MRHPSIQRSGPGRACVAARCALATLMLVMACWPGLTWAQTVESPPVALGLYQTVFPDDLSAVHEFASRTGHPLSIVHWYAIWGGWKSEFKASDFQAVSTLGAVPMITWEPWTGSGPDSAWSLRAAILSGAHDDYIDSWARGLSAYGGPVLLRFAHEMTDQPHYPWAVGVNGNTADEYIAAWHHVRAIFDRYPTRNVKWVWSPQMLGDASEAVHEARYRSVYPGDDLVDWLGLDAYNTGTALDWGTPRWRSFREVLSTPYAAITTISSKPMLLAEVGSSETGGSKAEWITTALSTELPAFPRVHALVWFDIAKEDAWTLHSSQSSFTAWISAASLPAFRSSLWMP